MDRTRRSPAADPQRHVRFILPDPLRPGDDGHALPAETAARIQTIRDLANSLLVQPLAAEYAIARGMHEELASFQRALEPLFLQGQALEEEITVAYDRGVDGLRALAARKTAVWEAFLQDTARFLAATRDERQRLGVILDEPAAIHAYEQLTASPALVAESFDAGTWVEDAPEEVCPADERARRQQGMREVEAQAVRAARALSGMDVHTRPLDRTLAQDPASARTWLALNPWEGELPLPVTPHPVMAAATPDALTAVRARVARALRDQADPLARWSRAATAEYEDARTVYLAAAPETPEEADCLVSTFADTTGGSPTERALRRLGEAWRHARPWLKVALGATCLAGVASGGIAAALGAGVAVGARTAGAFAAVDGIWQWAERRLLRRPANDARAAGAQAWLRAWHDGMSEAQDAVGVTRAALDDAVGLGELLDGAARAARKRPWHLAGKLTLATGLSLLVSTEAAAEVVGDVRERIEGVLPVMSPPLPPDMPTPPSPPTPSVEGHVVLASLPVDSATLRLVAGDVPYLDGAERLLRVQVLEEFVARGLPPEALGSIERARVLTATANLQRALGATGPMAAGEAITVPRAMVRAVVDNVWQRTDLDGARGFIDRVDWDRAASYVRRPGLQA